MHREFIAWAHHHRPPPLQGTEQPHPCAGRFHPMQSSIFPSKWAKKCGAALETGLVADWVEGFVMRNGITTLNLQEIFQDLAQLSGFSRTLYCTNGSARNSCIATYVSSVESLTPKQHMANSGRPSCCRTDPWVQYFQINGFEKRVRKS